MSRFETEIRPVIADEAAALSGTLDEAMAAALAQARVSTRAYAHDKFPHALPMMLRCGLRLELEKRGLPRDWRIGGDSKLMGQLVLRHDGYGVDLRFLKERRRSYPGGVPVAGHNPSRRQAWGTNDIPFDFVFSARTQIAERVTILWVYDFVGHPDNAEGGFTQRLVHTLAPGTYGRAVPCDLSLDLLPGGGIFDRLEFVGDDDTTDFFKVELAETAEDEE